MSMVIWCIVAYFDEGWDDVGSDDEYDANEDYDVDDWYIIGEQSVCVFLSPGAATESIW